MNENTIGARLRELRTAKTWSRHQVAEYLGRSRTHIYKLEHGFYPPSGADATALAKLFGVSQAYLTPEPSEPTEKDPPTKAVERFQLRGKPKERCCAQLYPQTLETVRLMAKESGLTVCEVLDQVVEYAVRNMTKT